MYVLVDTFNQYTFEPIKVILAKKLVGKQFAGKNNFEVDNRVVLPVGPIVRALVSSTDVNHS